jgi:hypothetical protein
VASFQSPVASLQSPAKTKSEPAPSPYLVAVVDYFVSSRLLHSD